MATDPYEMQTQNIYPEVGLFLSLSEEIRGLQFTNIFSST